ncbi:MULTISPECIES: DNA mismatch repair endonuclease MutL [unclassified Treponema]|uniref:DNA mismatch repair endonuclease MutL n=1 Tax=unclassified Treponema TaxID=2638727 RepID=UPI0020A4F0BB|nr:MULTISPECIES: DNA mismatch repair endonuclease MutL [unclassified Treponema]UTC67709.1 DNA mismatch repair endonuclease MutL [Treponema sp. OMZ 789]UTC70437.1 DNA mismatch repair endonuclease MutL [Treponema sp. OMZ 790]UTC73150.1 DNA mismatch repair endonuclease MutL [Treponema sp. OMZ 791]
MREYKPVKLLSKETASKIAAGEVIERPASVVRELLDNSIDAGASQIIVEIEEGGISTIRVSDDGCGMTREDLELCTQTHSTSKIDQAEDLLHLRSLGFRGEALSSVQAVSALEITSTREGPAAWKLSLGKISPARLNKGTTVEVKNLFENFPARKKFLKRPQYEASQCRQTFVEKALPHYNIEMRYIADGINKLILPSHSSIKERCLAAMSFKEPEELFYEINQEGDGFSFTAVLGSPAVVRSDKRNIYIFVNGRRINEYGLVQAACYASEGYFPNGGFPAAFVFLNVEPERVDFNIHPAKREAKFEDYKEIHHSLSSTISSFYRQKTVSDLLKESYEPEYTPDLGFEKKEFEAAELNQNYSSGLKETYWPGRTSAYWPASPIRQIETSAAAHGVQAAPQDLPKPDFKFLGQFCGTFIAVEKNNALYIIDRHAAHERILFEDLNASLGPSQELLIPYRIETESDKDDEIIRLNLPELQKAGFKINEEKKGLWIIRAVPIRWHGTEKDLKEDLAGAGKDPSGLMHHILASSACRAACKDGDIIDPVSAYNIAVKTFTLPEPLCPHGRPLYFIIDRTELFKRIKRT